MILKVNSLINANSYTLDSIEKFSEKPTDQKNIIFTIALR